MAKPLQTCGFDLETGIDDPSPALQQASPAAETRPCKALHENQLRRWRRGRLRAFQGILWRPAAGIGSRPPHGRKRSACGPELGRRGRRGGQDSACRHRKRLDLYPRVAGTGRRMRPAAGAGADGKGGGVGGTAGCATCADGMAAAARGSAARKRPRPVTGADRHHCPALHSADARALRCHSVTISWLRRPW